MRPRPHRAVVPGAVLAMLVSGVAARQAVAQVPTPSSPAKIPRQIPAAGGTNELDAFMEKVLARREVNRKTLGQYVLDESEDFEIRGPGRTPLLRHKREYTWYVRDGMHVRSPVRFSGVPVDEGARERYEREWIRRERSRREHEAGRQHAAGTAAPSSPEPSGTGSMAGLEPRFVSEAYFLEFEFEPGSYYLAGREPLEGQNVLRIEYYPTRMFGEDGKDDRAGADGDYDRDIQRKMNKTALVTLWVDPREHQIVKYTFDNVWLDFLPGAWLVRVDDIRASMTMGQPFPGVWLPRGLEVRGSVTVASGSFEARYERVFSEYRLAEVSTRMQVPKRSGLRETRAAPRARQQARRAGSGPGVVRAAFAPAGRPLDRRRRAARVRAPACLARSRQHGLLPGNTIEARVVAAGAGDDRILAGGPAAAGTQGSLSTAGGTTPAVAQDEAEVVREIRVHGNAFLTDSQVLQLAGLDVGAPLPPGGLDAIRHRLTESGLFDSVDVRKRHRSLTDTRDIALVLVVHERPGVRSPSAEDESVGRPPTPPGPMRRLRSRLMFLPILTFADGYGLTYGGRTSTVDLLGLGERLSVPLTWGGTRRAALEFERPFERGPLTRVESSLAIWNRQNPRFDIRDQRVEVKGRAERSFADVVRAGVEAGRSTISFAGLEDRLWTVGTTVTLDTRLDPAFPVNAVLLGAGWTRMHFRALPSPVNRHTADARGYVRVYRQVVLAARAQYTAADAPLPPYERLLLGGASSLRGFRAGAFDGDRTIAASAELRAPITSVLSGAKLGVTAFYDAGAAWDRRQRFDAAEWHRGVGAGLFLIASVFRINVDVAHGLKTGATRVHLSTGFAF